TTRPPARSSYSRESSSQSRAIWLRSRSRAWASTTDVTGSSETNSRASSERSISVTLTSRVPWASTVPSHLDLAERLRLGEVDLSVTVELQEREEAHDDLDPIFALRDQLSEHRAPGLPQPSRHHLDRVGDREGDRGDVGEVQARRRPQSRDRDRGELRRRDVLQHV